MTVKKNLEQENVETDKVAKLEIPQKLYHTHIKKYCLQISQLVDPGYVYNLQ